MRVTGLYPLFDVRVAGLYQTEVSRNGVCTLVRVAASSQVYGGGPECGSA